MKDKELIHVINQSVADTNYIKDDKIPCYNLKKVLKSWITIYMISNLIIYLTHTIGTVFNLIEEDWFFPLIRILYISLFLFTLIIYICLINKVNMSIKEMIF